MGVAAMIGKLSVGAVFLLFLPLPSTDEVGWKDGGAAALLLLLLPLLMYPKQAGESWVQGWETAETGIRATWDPCRTETAVLQRHGAIYPGIWTPWCHHGRTYDPMVK